MNRSTRAERVTFTISVLLLVLLVGSIVWIERSPSQERPRIDVTAKVDDAYEHGGSWYVPIHVRNVGEDSTDLLVVEVELDSPGAPEPELRTIEFTYVAGHDRASGLAVFERDPRAGALDARAVAITDP